MRINSNLFILILLLPTTSFSQELESKSDFEEKNQSDLFEKTYWMPERGVILLNDSSAMNAWNKMKQKSCGLQEDFDDLKALKVFRTEHLYIFNFENHKGYDWVVCQKKNGFTEFHAEGISGGYEDENPKKPFDTCSTGATNSSVRFRSYEKNGPLLLEVHIGGCRGGEAHHEFLFRLDREELEEIPGSRLVMHDYFSKSELKKGWMWTSYSYSRLGKISWNGKGNLVWKRFLKKHPMELVVYGAFETGHEKYQPSLFLRTCEYDSDRWIVECEDELKKTSLIDYDVISYYVEFKDLTIGELDYLISIRDGLKKDLKELGYYMKPVELEKLEKRINYLKEDKK